MKQILRRNIYERRIAHVVRLMFHDCVGETCDGCFNFDHVFNSGAWVDTIRLLNDLYLRHNFDQHISYADYYTLSAIVAIEEGVKNANRELPGSERVKMPRISFQIGRLDCPTAPNGTVFRALPDAVLNHTGMVGFYADQFGFTVEEAVAIQAGHTLGGATGMASSGWAGFFKENEHEGNKFDNRYYTMLLRGDLTWSQLDKARENGFFIPRWQWEGTDQQGNLDSFMLQSDLANFLITSIDSEGRSSCGFGQCATNPEGLAAVKKYADSYQDWLGDFMSAFLKMSTHGIKYSLKTLGRC